MNYNTTFQSLEIFCFNYTKDLVVSRMKIELRYIKLLSERYEYLKSARAFIRSIKPNEHSDLIFSSVHMLDIDKQRIERATAYYLIKDWIDEEFKKVELEVKKERNKAEAVKQNNDAQTSFKIKDEYSYLLKSMWELMKDYKSNMISYDTRFDDFEKVFLKIEEKDIINPIHWIGKKATLLRLFDDLMKNKILIPKNIGWNSNSKFTNPLDICFVKDEKCIQFLKWKSSYSKLSGDNRRKTNNQKTIDKIIHLFKADINIK